MREPTVLTIILNYETAQMTVRSLKAALLAMNGIKGAVSVVDNDSQDGSYEEISQAVQSFAPSDKDRVRVIQSGHNGGFGAGNNVGIRARLPNGDVPDYIYILNPDAFPEKDAIKLLLAYLQSNLSVGFAGSRSCNLDGTPHFSAFRFPTIQSEFEGAAQFGPISRLLKNYTVPLPIPDQTCKVDWLAGASMMIRQTVIDEIGLFDETFFLYFEETELCHRAKLAGWPTVYVYESEVAHIGSGSTGLKTCTRIPAYWLNSRLYYFVKTHGRFYAVFATLAHLSGGVIRQVRCTIQIKPIEGPSYFLRDLAMHSLRVILNTLRKSRSKTLNDTSHLARQDTK